MNRDGNTADKIRSAAIELFSTHGFARTTVRSIAQAAEVSPGLVIHHFGSKDGLREACDDYVFDAIVEAKKANAQYSPLSVQSFLADPAMRRNLDYLVRSLIDPSAAGQRYFDHYVALTEEYVTDGFADFTFRPSDDPRGKAVVIATLALAPMLLLSRASTALGTDGIEETLGRMAPHLLDLYLHGIFESLPPSTTAPDSTTSRDGDDLS